MSIYAGRCYVSMHVFVFEEGRRTGFCGRKQFLLAGPAVAW